MSKNVVSTLSYFSQFNYPASIEQLHTFHSSKISQALLQKKIDALVQSKKVRSMSIDGEKRYYLNSTKLNAYQSRFNHSAYLLQQARRHLRLFELIPLIKYIGISGSLSMLNASKTSDIDLFIVTTPGTLWIVRFVVLIYKKIQSVLNPSFGNKLCINLIFAQNGLSMRKKKQTEYVGHELLQLNTIFNKSQTYEIMLKKNKWIALFFPNYTPHDPPSRGELKRGVQINYKKIKSQFRLSKQSFIILLIEQFLRSIQTSWLDRKGYKYRDTGKQLWLIQKDYEKELTK